MTVFGLREAIFGVSHDVWHFLVQKIFQLAQREMVANTVSAAAADQDHKITQRGKRRCARTGALHLPPCILLLTLMKIDTIVSVVKQTCPLFSTIFYIIYLFYLRVHNIICNKKNNKLQQLLCHMLTTWLWLILRLMTHDLVFMSEEWIMLSNHKKKLH